jgi:DNA polymerase epsilon subunit 2
MYRDRFDLIKQRVLRTELFRPPPQTMLKMAAARKQQYQKITPIVALKGCKPGRFTLFGMLTVMADGKWYLEDPDTLIELENFALVKAVSDVVW